MTAFDEVLFRMTALGSGEARGLSKVENCDLTVFELFLTCGAKVIDVEVR